jgi:hypothetical protein
MYSWEFHLKCDGGLLTSDTYLNHIPYKMENGNFFFSDSSDKMNQDDSSKNKKVICLQYGASLIPEIHYISGYTIDVS